MTDNLNTLPRKQLPPFPGWMAALGPGIIWMALAQGSGELIWWPYMIAKYGLTFLFLLLPACFLQYPLTVEIGRYTLATGESIFHGFIRLNPKFGIFLWILMTLSFLWFGAFAAAGGTALSALTDFPSGWSARGQTLFWGYCSIAVFFIALLISPVIYTLIEWFMKGVALVTLIGMLWACMQPEIIAVIPKFIQGLAGPVEPWPRNWDPNDATKLLTAITFAGLGGFWILFYSYWLHDKGSGMAVHNGRITGLTNNSDEKPDITGNLPEDNADNARLWKQWLRYIRIDVIIGISGNVLTTLMTCLLAYAILFPKGLLPQDYDLAVVQASFFEISWGHIGRLVFLIIAGAFLADTWLATVDAVARIQAENLHIVFPWSRRWSLKFLYYVFVCVLTMITCITMLFEAPGPLILISAVIGFCGTVIFPVALYFLNYRLVPASTPAFIKPARGSAWLLWLSFCAYLVLALLYIGSLFLSP